MWMSTQETVSQVIPSAHEDSKDFLNANEAHVAKVVQRLGLEDSFDDIICFATLNPKVEVPESDSKESPKMRVVCKPHENAFEQAFRIADINPHKTLFFDDSIRNLQTAKITGLHTFWVCCFCN